MTTYILRRLLLVPVTLFILSFGTAMIMRLTPGDVVDYRLQNSYNPERADALREQLGLNKGPFEAYFDWISTLSRVTSAVRSSATRPSSTRSSGASP